MSGKMGKSLPCAAVSLLVLLATSQPAVVSASGSGRRPRYHSIFSFGDSFSDTGNKPVAFGWYSLPSNVMRPPYGSTFFGHPTGRSSDGRLVLDLVADCLGLPFVPPFLAHNGSLDFAGGANFAVAGATALDAGFFHGRDIPSAASKFPLNTSLNVQLQWFESLLPSLCGTAQECKEFLGGSLFFVGEFGVNDYNLLMKKMSLQQVRSFAPVVVTTITMAIERMIKLGAKSIVVPGVVPSGCSPPVLTFFADGRAGEADYDAVTGCLRDVNELGVHHNSLLRLALRELRCRHPDSTIVYADFFRPVMDMVESPREFGERFGRCQDDDD
ncbi:hypothetical protein ABZP36_017094 [Zizania latifolia]